MATSHFNYSNHMCTHWDTYTYAHKHEYIKHMHSEIENNTSSKTQRYKGLFHSLPATVNFKQVLHA